MAPKTTSTTGTPSFPDPSAVAAGKRAPAKKAAPKKGPAAPSAAASGPPVTVSSDEMVQQFQAFLAGKMQQASGGAMYTQPLSNRVAQFRAQLSQGSSPDLANILDYQVTPGKLAIDDKTYSGAPRTIRGMLGDPSRWNTNEVQALQSRLLAGGYYDPQFYKSPEKYPIGKGQYDQATRVAYAKLLSDGVLYQDLNLDQLLTRNAQGNAALIAALAASGHTHQGIVGGGNVYVNQLDDPATLRNTVDTAAEALMGRRLDDHEKADFVKTLTSHEGTAQEKVNAAREAADRRRFAAQAGNAAAADAGRSTGDTYIAPTTIDAPNVDPKAQAEDMIRKRHAPEVGAHDLANVYDDFRSIIGGSAL